MDTSLLRNRLRLETLPQLEALKPGIRRLLAQVADIAGMDDDYIDVQLQTVVIEQVRVDSGRVTFPRDWFRALHPALARRLILHASEQLNAIDSPDYAHIIEAVEIGLRGRQGALALLGSHLRLRVDYDRLVIEREDSPPPAYDVPLLAAGEQLSVPVPGNLPLEGWMLCTSLTATPGVTEARMSIPPGAVVTLRTRRAGDRFAPPGMGGKHQKLARWMVNRKLPRTLRDRLPLICVDGQVAAMMIDTEWIIAEPFVVRENSAGVVHFHFRQIL